MKVVLFCGGLGMRLRDYSESIPKPLVHVGSGRYWPSFAPLLAIGFVFLVELARDRFPRDPATPAAAPAGDGSSVVGRAPHATFLLVAQALLALLFCAAVGVLLWLGT